MSLKKHTFLDNVKLPRGDATRPVIHRRRKDLACGIGGSHDHCLLVRVIGDNFALASHPQMGPRTLILLHNVTKLQRVKKHKERACFCAVMA